MRASLGVLLAALAWCSCGGVAVVDPPTGEGGNGNAGGSGAGGPGSGASNVVSATSGPVSCTIAGIDRECFACAENACDSELGSCCAADGCVELLSCVVQNCEQPDPGCVLRFCSDELQAAGGPGGKGTSAARAFSDCATDSCDPCG